MFKNFLQAYVNEAGVADAPAGAFALPFSQLSGVAAAAPTFSGMTATANVVLNSADTTVASATGLMAGSFTTPGAGPVVKGFQLGDSRQLMMVSTDPGNAYAIQQISYQDLATNGPNEIDVVTITGAPTGGTFTVTVKNVANTSATTAGIAFNASAATVQTAMRGLSTVGGTNASVAGSNGGPWTITFAPSLEWLTVTASGAGLTGGASPAATAVQTAAGLVHNFENIIGVLGYRNVNGGVTVVQNLEGMWSNKPGASTKNIEYYWQFDIVAVISGHRPLGWLVNLTTGSTLMTTITDELIHYDRITTQILFDLTNSGATLNRPLAVTTITGLNHTHSTTLDLATQGSDYGASITFPTGQINFIQTNGLGTNDLYLQGQLASTGYFVISSVLGKGVAFDNTVVMKNNFTMTFLGTTPATNDLHVTMTNGNRGQIYPDFYAVPIDVDCSTLNLQTNSGGTTVFGGPARLKSYTVSTLPTAGTATRTAYASNGRNPGEGAGSGTGVIVFDNGTQWRAVSTGLLVTS